MGNRCFSESRKNVDALASKLILERLTKLNLSSLDETSLNRVKLEVCKNLGLNKIPPNSEIINLLKGESSFRSKLTIKKGRSASGVIVVAVMSKPFPCPHGKCAYCPTVEGVPQSYTGHEPSSMRGLQHDFDPYLQVKSRLTQLYEIGHEIDKIELIIQGGTFPSTPISYQKWFIKRCLDVMNKIKSSSIDDAKEKAESAHIRNVGITVETRPDWCKEDHVDLMLNLGITRVELGVQTLDDSIYNLVERGHTVSDVIDAIRIAKDSGLKVCTHIMPGLPGSTPSKDLTVFKSLFQDPQFKPDMLKIYPCLTLKGTKLYDWLLLGEYRPYNLETIIELLADVKKIIPNWIRVMRVQRDIPAKIIVDGVKKSNLRQLIHRKLLETGDKCRCIRCREIGLKNNFDPSVLNLEMGKVEYTASQGLELFISVEDFEKEVLVGYVRVRIPSKKAHRPEVTDAALVRELHIYGKMIPVGSKSNQAFQHKGWGTKLLDEAEVEAARRGAEKILITSGLGVKSYYRERGYSNCGPYMCKFL